MRPRLKPFWSCIPCLLAAVLFLAPGCANKDSSLESSLKRVGLDNPAPAAFSVCVRFGCKETELIGLDVHQWGRVEALFDPRPDDAEAERRVVARAVALLEALVGRMVLTWDDQPENEGSSRGTRQLDCIAESMNTSVALVMLHRAGLLRFHVPGSREKRGLGIFSPHNTATLTETATGQRWAVDSWFRVNGREPHVVPLEEWLQGWEPEP